MLVGAGKTSDASKRFSVGALVVLFLFSATPVRSAERQLLRNHIPAVTSKLRPVDRLASSKRLNLVFALPLRNQKALTNLLQQLYDPTSSNYRQYLTPQQFAERFGPTEQDYRAVMDFVRAQGLTVTGTHPNRTLLDVSGTVAEIESAFHVNLVVYNHPIEARTFYAPDVEPSIDLTVQALEVVGLDDYVMPRPMYHQMATPLVQANETKPNVGSGPGGTFMGNDFRAAYIPGIALTGSGQKVGLLEFDGYFTNDPVQYAIQAGLTNILTITNVLVDGFDGTPGSYNVEVALDIEMVMSMAPGAQIIVYEGSITTPTIIIDLLNRMATDNLAQQLSASWTYHTGPAMEQVFQQMAGQGQSFFNCSGDHDAYSGTVTTPADDPYITIVGGTTLTTSGPGSNWVSETCWNWGNDIGSGGGISTSWAIPSWQQGINMSSNNGSTTMRNLPDVAMVADRVYAIADNGAPQYLGGTSISTPLWAAFTALVNEKAGLQGKQPVGFVNYALYAIGQGTNYNTAFHDITTGNNTNSNSPNNFFAVPGYDLCTGWGTPTPNLIDAMLNVQFVIPNGWTLTSLPNEDWSGVASSADGTKLVAVDLSGGHQIYVSSSSGVIWRPYGPAASWRGIASSADGTKLAAAPWYGSIYISTDSGVTWTATTSPSYSWRSMASSADGTKLAAGAFWEGVFEVSTNSGATWMASSMSGSINWMPVAWSADGGVLVAACGSTVYVSTNSGATSRSTTLPGMNCTSVASAADGSKLFAAGGSIYISTNLGASWTISGPASGAGLVACSGDGYRLAAVSDQVYISDDGGTTWTCVGPRTPPTYMSWSTIACSADGSRLIAAIEDYYDGPVYTGVFPRSGPIITTPPANQAAVVGSDAVFSVVAIGPPPLTYQWSYNGTNILGATNSWLILTNVQFSQAGYYGVQVNDVYGSRFSPNVALTVVPPPVTILVQPTNQTAVLGTAVRFTVTALGTPPLSYQWLFNGTNMAGATNSELMLFNVQPTNAGTYAVTVANAYGPITSSNAVLTLISPTPCAEPPSGLISWWQAEGNAIDRMGTINGSLVGNTTYGPGFIGQCFVLDGDGDAITLGNLSSFGLQVFTVEMWIKRTSTTLSTQNGSKAYLFAFGGGEDGFGLFNDGTLFFQSGCCYGTGAPVNDTNWHHVAVTATGTGDTIYIDGTVRGGSMWPKSFSLTTVAIGARGDATANSFYGAIDEPSLYNRVLSDTEIQSIYNAGVYGKCLLPAPPFILSQPTNQAVEVGSTATFTVAVGGMRKSLSYQWQFNGTNIVGQTNASLVLTNVQFPEAGTYAVLLTNAFGSTTSSSAILTVYGLPPAIISQPTNQTVEGGSTATFAVVAGGTHPLSYQWSCNGTHLTGATNASLVLTNVQRSQAGTYAVLVTNAFGSTTSSSAILTVYGLLPAIISQPTNQTVEVGSTVTFAVLAGGTRPLSYQWSCNGTNLTEATDASLVLTNVQLSQEGTYVVLVTNAFGSILSSNAVLTVSPGYVNTVNIGTSATVRTNGSSVGRGTGLLASKDVAPRGYRFALLTSATVTQSEPANILDAQWRFTGVTMTNFIYFGSVNGGAHVPANYWHYGQSNAFVVVGWSANLGSNWLTISNDVATGAWNTSDGCNGYFGVSPIGYGIAGPPPPEIAFRIWGNTSTSGVPINVQWDLYAVGTRPVISSHPTNQTVVVGGAATFTVVAGGMLPLSYQWQFNGADLCNDTNFFLTFTHAQSTNAGFYQVVVTNVYGSVTSSVATLSILGVPVSFSTSGEDIRYINGQFLIKLIDLTGQGPLVMETSTNLTDWSPIFTNPAAFGEIKFADPVATNNPQRFYRALVR